MTAATATDEDLFLLKVRVWKYAGQPIKPEDVEILFEAADMGVGEAGGRPGALYLYAFRPGVRMEGRGSDVVRDASPA